MKSKFKILPWILNKYVVTLIAFMVLLTFFDTHNLLLQGKLKREEHSLIQKRNFYIEQIEADRQAKQELMSNEENKEKYAREHYKMKRDNEVVFVVTPAENED